MKNEAPPGKGGAAVAQKQIDAQLNSRCQPALQADAAARRRATWQPAPPGAWSAHQSQRCAGCGAAQFVLVPVLGWHEGNRPALLCPSCKRSFRGHGRRRYGRTLAARHLT